MTEQEKTPKCPACGSIRIDTEHLLFEYREMVKAGFDRMFGYNARKCGNEIVDILHSRGIIDYPTIFGRTNLRKWNS